MKRLLTVLMVGLLVAAFTAPTLAWEFSMNGEYQVPLQVVQSVPVATTCSETPTVQTGDGDIDFPGFPGVPVVNSVGFAGPNTYGRGAVFAAGAPVNVVGIPANETGIGDTSTSAVSGIPGNAGWRITRGGYARWASDALQSDSRWTMRPTIRVNKAIRVHGVYNIGGYRHKYAQRATYNTYDTFITGLGIGERLGGNPTAGVPPFENYYQSQTSMNAEDTAAIGSWQQFRRDHHDPLGYLLDWCEELPIRHGDQLRSQCPG